MRWRALTLVDRLVKKFAIDDCDDEMWNPTGTQRIRKSENGCKDGKK